MRVAISHWQGRISPVFDVAARATILEISGHRETGRESIDFTGRALLERTKMLSRRGVEMVICGAISRSLEKDLIGAGIQVIGFVCGDMEDVVSAFMTDRLSDPCFCMPGTRKTVHHFKSKSGPMVNKNS